MIRQPILGYERVTPWEFCWEWRQRHTLLLAILLAVYFLLTGCVTIPVFTGAIFGPIGTAVVASATASRCFVPYERNH